MCVEFVGHVYQKTNGYNCTQVVSDIFLFSYEADFVQHVQKSKFKKQTQTSFNLRVRYIDVVISFNDYIDVIQGAQSDVGNREG